MPLRRALVVVPVSRRKTALKHLEMCETGMKARRECWLPSEFRLALAPAGVTLIQCAERT